MDAKASACALTCVVTDEFVWGVSGSDHIHADRIALLLALTAL
jgi:hypothetical protein